MSASTADPNDYWDEDNTTSSTSIGIRWKKQLDPNPRLLFKQSRT